MALYCRKCVLTFADVRGPFKQAAVFLLLGMQKAWTTVVSCILFSLLASATTPTIRLQAGMIISESVTIGRENYSLNAKPILSEALIEIAGNNIVVDFNNAVLQGSNDKDRSDEFYGLAIRIRKGSKNITIKNAVVHGYKIAILADSVERLTIEHSDLSYNWRQHLNSNRDREDISDWMSYHTNEKQEWMRYGAGIYLANCQQATISNNIITGGQCALMITRCNNAEIFDNDFSFNSGIGIGLYRSSNNKIYHNRLDYNVRGFSNGKYRRGQDSAGILVFEQSSDNIFAYNTATHSGDGFFLWAGQSTMDSGKGGCNDNFIYGNDFSYAPTNGVEITFSRNLVMKNIIKNCDHGIWGGYSFETDITDNSFENNRIGIAIEHGQLMNIALNGFMGDKTGIKLWSREKQPDDWAYPKLRNTESRNYWIAANRFTSVGTALDVMGTDTVVLNGNTKLLVENELVIGDRVDNIDTSREQEFLDIDYQKDPRLKEIKADTTPLIIVPQGLEQIRITEWGPYDFRYPLAWLKEVDKDGSYHFELLGPKGNWELKSNQGYGIQQQGSNSFPSSITVKPDNNIVDRSLQFSFIGAGFTDAFGKKQDSAQSHVFSFNEFQPNTTWDIRWYQWDAAHDPAGAYSQFEKLFDQPAVYSTKSNQIDFTWWGAIGKELPADSFATVASTAIQLKAGNYEISITADDYARVYVDGKEVIDAWDAKYTQRDEDTHHRVVLPLNEGEHSFRIIHAENKGLAVLQFYIKPVGRS
jgi:parallel beta-helix repeat protein